MENPERQRPYSKMLRGHQSYTETKPAEAAKKRGCGKWIAIIVGGNVVGVAVLTAVQWMLGDALLGQYTTGGNYNEGTVAWFFACLSSGVCTMIAVDFFLVILGAMIVALVAFFGKRTPTKPKSAAPADTDTNDTPQA